MKKHAGGLIAKTGEGAGQKLPVPTTVGDDTVIAAKSGEYVLPPEVVAMIGVDKLDAMVAMMTGKMPGGEPARMPNGGMGLQGFAAGGAIKPDDIKMGEKYREANRELVSGVLQPTSSAAQQAIAQGETAKGMGIMARGLVGSLASSAGNAASAVADNVVRPVGRGLIGFARGATGNDQLLSDAAPQAATQPAAPKATALTAPPPSASGAARGLPGFNASAPTDAQRNASGDAYRDAWQREAPGGMRNAGIGALGLYNAEQQVRGTGITARRQPNGVMEFSGNGANARPQQYTSGVDLAGSNEGLARANAIRQSTIDTLAGGREGPGGGGISNSQARESLATSQRWALEDAMKDKSLTKSQREQMMEAHFKPQELALNGRKLDQDAQLGLSRLGLEQQRESGENARFAASHGLEQQRVEGEAETRGFQTRAARRMEQLYTQYDKATSAERSVIAEKIRTLSGKDAPNRFTVAPGGQEWDAGAGAMRNVPARVLNNQTGQFVEQPSPQNLGTDPRAATIRSNPDMSREQKVEALRQLGYQ